MLIFDAAMPNDMTNNTECRSNIPTTDKFRTMTAIAISSDIGMRGDSTLVPYMSTTPTLNLYTYTL